VDLPIANWSSRDPVERARNVLNFQKSYHGPDAWWWSGDRFSQIKLQAWIFHGESAPAQRDLFWWNDPTHLNGQENPLELYARINNYHLGNGGVFDPAMLANYTFYINPINSRVTGRLEPDEYNLDDWSRLLEPPTNTDLYYITTYTAPPPKMGGEYVENFWVAEQPLNVAYYAVYILPPGVGKNRYLYFGTPSQFVAALAAGGK
jgi:hypothetical protein